ncbi:MAG TPA: FAD-dependent monooxygenase [Sphingobium sp.]|nr:FAD-dependent monooxygenase [Sphingobium sp.]
MAQQRDVVIVGAGPVGFLVALGLARQGIDVTLLDAADDIVNSPRAAIYFPTTLELLDRLGVIDDCLAIGYRCERLAMRYPEVGEVIALDYQKGALPGQLYPFNLHFGQHELAGVVSDHLQRLPHARVHWRHRVVGLEQAGERVLLDVETPDGPTQISARWVVGTDGARSTVRHLLGLPFEGFTWPERFVATNVEVDFHKLGYCDANMVVDPVNWAVVARLGKGPLWRLTYGEDSRLDEATMAQRIPERYRAFIPAGEPYRVVQAAPYRCHERCAPRFRVDRVLLAGDAAHACNPCGGLGLTTGVMDANALSQILGAVVHGQAGEHLLDDYAEQRRRIFLEVTSPSAQHFKQQLSERDPARRAEQRAIMRKSMDDPATAQMATLIAQRIMGEPLTLGRAARV